jgi:hypothetical protein
MVTEKDWADSSDSEDELDYDNIALMARASDKSGSPKKTSSSSDKVSLHSLDSFDSLDSDDITTINVEFRNFMTNFRILTNERDELKIKNDELVNRNNVLESELVQMEECKLVADKAKHDYNVILEAYDFVRKELEEERDTIRIMNNSGKKTQEIFDSGIRGKVKGLGFDKAREEAMVAIVIDDSKSEANTSKSEGKKIISEPKHVKFVDSNGTPVVHKIINNNVSDKKVLENPKSVNIGFLSKSQLKQRLEGLSESSKTKRNRNGKEGINKENNYKNVPDAPRKKCFKCGNHNHLALDCNQKPSWKTESRFPKTQKIQYQPQNACYHCGSLLHSIYMCKDYHELYYDYYSLKSETPSHKQYVKSESKIDSETGSIKVKSSRPVVSKVSKKGSNQCWIPKTSN